MSDADAIDKTGNDWPTRAADTVVGYVDTVRTATTGRALDASRWMVYGIVLILIAPILLILFLIGLVRGLTAFFAWLPGPVDFESGEVWPSYILLGTVFFLLGMWFWRKKGQ